MLRNFFGPLAGWLVLVAVSTARAENVGSVEIVNAEAGLYQKLTQDPASTANRGFVQSIAAPEGKLFLVVWLELKLKPGKAADDDDEMVQIEDKSISLTAAGQGPIPVVGRCTRDGRFSTGGGDFYYSGQPETATVPFDPVFAVPAKTKSFEITIGEAKQAIKVTTPLEPTIARGAAASFQFQKAEAIENLTTKEEIGPFDNRQGAAVKQIESMAGKYLVLHLVVKPKTGNAQGSFQFSSEDIGLAFGSQVYAGPVGYIAYNEFVPYANTYSSQRDAAGDYAAVAATIVYPLPGKITKFKVLYLLDPVAEGAVGK